MHNGFLWAAAICLGGLLTAATGGDRQAYRQSFREEMRQCRIAKREITQLARNSARISEAAEARLLRESLREQRHALRESLREERDALREAYRR